MNTPLSNADYDRIHRVIRAVLDGAGAKTSFACQFFALAGAVLLDKWHSLEPSVQVGAALFGVGGSPPGVLAFARFEDGLLHSDRNSFHAWIELQDWAIDFMAPVFPENAAARGISLHVPRLRFQRSIASMVQELKDLEQSGSFALEANPELRESIMTPVIEREATLHMLEQCSNWYRPSPAVLPDEFAIVDFRGRPATLALAPYEIGGDW